MKKTWWEVLAALTPLILGICVTGIGVFFTNVYNFRQLQLNQLSALEKFRGLLVSENPYDREFAYASFAALGYENLAIKLINLKDDSAGRAVVQEIKLSGSASAKVEAASALPTLPVQVYIQIAAEEQREKAQQIRNVLQQKGYVAPGIENISGKADIPKNTNVRYFNEEDKSIADAVVSILKEHGISSAYAYRVSRLKVKPGSLEIWFSADAV
ncbi:MAG: SPOR domain-containing protein [Methylococcales bacterium]